MAQLDEALRYKPEVRGFDAISASRSGSERLCLHEERVARETSWKQ